MCVCSTYGIGYHNKDSPIISKIFGVSHFSNYIECGLYSKHSKFCKSSWHSYLYEYLYKHCLCINECPVKQLSVRKNRTRLFSRPFNFLQNLNNEIFFQVVGIRYEFFFSYNGKNIENH